MLDRVACLPYKLKHKIVWNVVFHHAWEKEELFREVQQQLQGPVELKVVELEKWDRMSDYLHAQRVPVAVSDPRQYQHPQHPDIPVWKLYPNFFEYSGGSYSAVGVY